MILINCDECGKELVIACTNQMCGDVTVCVQPCSCTAYKHNADLETLRKEIAKYTELTVTLEKAMEKLNETD